MVVLIFLCLFLLCLMKCQNLCFMLILSYKSSTFTAHWNEWKTFSTGTICHLKCPRKNNVHFYSFIMPTFSLWVDFKLNLSSSVDLIAHIIHSVHIAHLFTIFKVFSILFLCKNLLSSTVVTVCHPRPTFHLHQIFHFLTLWSLTRFAWLQGTHV